MSAQASRRNTMIPSTARAVTTSLHVISMSSWCIVLMRLVLCHQDPCSWPRRCNTQPAVSRRVSPSSPKNMFPKALCNPLAIPWAASHAQDVLPGWVSPRTSAAVRCQRAAASRQSDSLSQHGAYRPIDAADGKHSHECAMQPRAMVGLTGCMSVQTRHWHSSCLV